LKFQPAAERNATAITCEIEDPEITITVDEYCLGHALANLLDNAVKFNERGRVIVRAYRESDGSICVNVEDTGVGIDPSYVPNLFEPFSQEDSSQARPYQGMGLGLALAKRYLALNGAELSVTSRKYAGSVFTIRFAEKHDVASGQVTGRSPTPPAPRPPLQSAVEVVVAVGAATLEAWSRADSVTVVQSWIKSLCATGSLRP